VLDRSDQGGGAPGRVLVAGDLGGDLREADTDLHADLLDAVVAARLGQVAGAVEGAGDAVHDVGQERLVLHARDPGHDEARFLRLRLHVPQEGGLSQPAGAGGHGERPHHLSVGDHPGQPITQASTLVLPADEDAGTTTRCIRVGKHPAPPPTVGYR